MDVVDQSQAVRVSLNCSELTTNERGQEHCLLVADEHFAKEAQVEICTAAALRRISVRARHSAQRASAQNKNPSACEGFLAVATAGEKVIGRCRDRTCDFHRVKMAL